MVFAPFPRVALMVQGRTFEPRFRRSTSPTAGEASSVAAGAPVMVGPT